MPRLETTRLCLHTLMLRGIGSGGPGTMTPNSLQRFGFARLPDGLADGRWIASIVSEAGQKLSAQIWREGISKMKRLDSKLGSVMKALEE
ncbi:MAG: hypothetical protein Q9166_002642 [cf. Caloplaca sp. 2 TL-2023]